MRENLREAVLSTTSLLLDAVDRLETGDRCGNRSGDSSGDRSGAAPSATFRPPSTSTSGCHSSKPVEAELTHLFSWNRLGKRGNKSRKSDHPSKKKKLKTWTHTFVCLGHVAHRSIPDANERTMLKLAGLGEKRFSVFAYGSSAELQDDLIREFPKLADGGGYELLRAPETGSRELVTIDIPHEGYSVEYLQAVVKSAKVFIRPLQKDLDTRPRKKAVSQSLNVIVK